MMKTKEGVASKTKRKSVFLLLSAIAIGVAFFGLNSLKHEKPNFDSPDEDLLIAVQEGDPQKTEDALRRGANANLLVDRSAQTPNFQKPSGADIEAGQTPAAGKPVLIAAFMSESSEVIRMLIKHGAETSRAMEDGQTPLHFAAKQPKATALKELLERNIDIDPTDKTGKTPLHFAAANTLPDCCQALLEEGADVLVKDASSRTPLITAINYGRPKNVLILLKKGANIDDFLILKHQEKSNASGAAPKASSGARGGQPVNLSGGRVLRAAGMQVSDISLKPGFPGPFRTISTPLEWAASQGDLPLFKYLFEKRDAKEENRVAFVGYLEIAVASGSRDVAEFLFNLKLIPISTPRLLNIALTKVDFEMAKLLIERGVPNNGSQKGEIVPLILATRMLSELNAVINVQTSDMRLEKTIKNHGSEITVIASPVLENKTFVAIQKDKIVDLIIRLVSKGADVNATDLHGDPPMKFVLSEHILAQMFLHKGVNARTRLRNGETFLMQAVNMRPETAKLLIQSGADVNAKDDSGMTALMYAAKFYNARLVKTLLDHGADPKAMDRSGHSALRYATQTDYAPILELLKAAQARNEQH